LFVDLSFNPQTLDGLGRNIAHFACAGGSFDCCRELDLLGVDFEALDGEGRLPAEYAAEMGPLDLLQWLWTRGSLNAMSEQWKKSSVEPAIPRWAALHGHTAVLKFLIDVVGAPVFKRGPLPNSGGGFTYRTTAVHCACAGGHEPALRVLLERGGNAAKVDGRSRMPVTLAIESGSLGCVKLLAERGGMPKKEASRRRLPVVDAAKFSHLDILRYLLREQKLDVNAETVDGETALTAAAKYSTEPVIRFLVKEGATPSPAALLAAAQCCTDAVIRLLVKEGAAPSPAALIATIKLGKWDAAASLAALVSDLAQGDAEKLVWAVAHSPARSRPAEAQLSAVLTPFAVQRSELFAAALDLCRIDVLKALASAFGPPTPAELANGGKPLPNDWTKESLPWLEALAELQPDWSRATIRPNYFAATESVAFAYEHGATMTRDDLRAELNRVSRNISDRRDFFAAALQRRGCGLLSVVCAEFGNPTPGDLKCRIGADFQTLTTLVELQPDLSQATLDFSRWGLRQMHEALILGLKHGAKVEPDEKVKNWRFGEAELKQLPGLLSASDRASLREPLLTAALECRSVGLLDAFNVAFGPPAPGELARSIRADLPLLKRLVEVQPDLSQATLEDPQVREAFILGLKHGAKVTPDDVIQFIKWWNLGRHDLEQLPCLLPSDRLASLRLQLLTAALGRRDAELLSGFRVVFGRPTSAEIARVPTSPDNKRWLDARMMAPF
jgi:ankyrin repeat protein